MPPAGCAEYTSGMNRAWPAVDNGRMMSNSLHSARVAWSHPTARALLAAALALSSATGLAAEAPPTPLADDAIAVPAAGFAADTSFDAPLPADETRLMSQAWSESDPRRYFVADVLGMQRNNALKYQPLAVESTTRFVGLSSNQLQSTFAPGIRLLYGQYGEGESVGWETGYIGLWNMYSHSQVDSPGSVLQAPGGLGFASPAYRDASHATFTGVTSLQSADVNLVLHSYDGGFDRLSPRAAQRCDWYDGGHLDWLAGFRWADLEDSAQLGFIPSGGTSANTYSARTTSNLFAGQVGVRGRMEFQEWALESWIKIGLAGTSVSQSQSFYDQLAPDSPFRTPRSGWHGGVGMISDANLSAVWRMNRVWGVRMGYNLMWLTGVGLAADQLNFSANQGPSTGTAIDSTGSLALSGVNAGLEARW